MKNIKRYTYLIVGFIMVFFSCEVEESGPLTSDSTAPGPVSEVMVTNLPGGAKISYTIPDDEDALLVEAIYKLDNGKQVTSKSSIFKDFVLVEGLRKVQPQEVALVTVDRSNNRSQPVIVSITPETAPIDKLFSSFELVEDFGGVRLYFNNEDKIAAEILLYAADEKGNLVYSQSAFISDDQRSRQTFREFPPVPNKFGVSAIDRWNNVTEILEAERTPLEEIKLDIWKFKEMFLTGDEPNCCGWVMPFLWNERIADPGFHTTHIAPGSIVPPYTEKYHIFTMDLGVKAKLSRFKFWQRQRADKDGLYSHGNPRYFEVWGIDEIPADKGASLEGWTKLIENGEVVKPSGAPAGTNSAEDLAKAASGEEYDFPIEAPPVRYIRFVNLQNWAGTKFMFLTELNFWGQIAE
jgi:hypothetical protein